MSRMTPERRAEIEASAYHENGISLSFVAMELLAELEAVEAERDRIKSLIKALREKINTTLSPDFLALDILIRDVEEGNEAELLRELVAKQDDRLIELKKALEDWMQSYSIMVERTHGIHRDSIRGFFLDCPHNTKKVLKLS